MSKTLSTYIAAFDYFDKILLFLSAISGGVSIASFATVIGSSDGITSASFSVIFSISIEILKIMRKKKKKHNIVLLVASCKLNSIENRRSKAPKDNELVMKTLQRL